MSVRAKVVIAFIIGVATIPLLIAAAAWLGCFPVAATYAPPRWERRLAGRALDTSLSRSAKGLAAPITEDDPTLLAGLKVALFLGRLKALPPSVDAAWRKPAK